MATYSEQQLLDKLRKLNLEIGDLIAQVNEDFQRSNTLINVEYLKALANCINTVNIPDVRQNIIFARNMIGDLLKLMDEEEKRRYCKQNLDVIRQKDNVKNQRKRKREEEIQEDLYNFRAKRQNSLS